MKPTSKVRIRTLGAVCVVMLGLVIVLSCWAPPRQRRSSIILREDPGALIAEANRLSWLGNWYAAGPFYAEAEKRFHAAGNLENEIYARLGRIRAQAPNVPVDDTLAHFDKELGSTTLLGNPRLHMFGRALRASITIDTDSGSARRDWTETLRLATKLGEPQWAARATGELGIFAFLEGNTASAVSLLGKAILAAYRTGDTASQVRLLSMLGLGFNEERRYSEALMMFNRAIATAEQTPDAGFPYLAYRGKAAALLGLHQIDAARQLLIKAMAATRTQNDRVHEADLLVESGEVAVASRDPQEAERSFRRAGEIANELRLYRTLAETMFDLAGLEKQLGARKAAIHALRTGLAASQRLGDHYYVPRDLTALAELKEDEKRFREADELFAEAEDVLDGIIVNQHSFEESTARAGSMSPTYLGHFRLAKKMGHIARAFQVIERVRGRTVASKLFVREQSGAKSPSITKLEGDIAATQLALLRTEETKARSSLMEQLLADERNLAFELNETGLQRRAMLVNPVPLKALQTVLTGDELFAEYVLDEPKSFCVVVTKRSARLITLPAGSRSIRDLTAAYLSELKSRRSGDQFAAELYRLLLEPVVSLYHQNRLVISPDDILNVLPFEALRDKSGYVILSKVVSYTPSATVLWRLRNTEFMESGRPLLAVGAVDYRLARALPQGYAHNSVAAVVVRGLAELTGSQLQDLPASRDEVLAIAQIAGPRSQLLLGQNATETGFKTQSLAEFRVIHLATHAAADPQYPDRAALILGVAHNTQDDGLLQVREIMGLSLSADLVTLSACDTSVGTDQREAGVVNLEQAFLIAGARAVVASLWNVEDNSTTVLMKAFYTHLAQHEDKALALAHAKRDVLERYGDASPYYWAPFVLVGEGAQPVAFGR